jgi:hypothetical protein
MKQSGYAKPLEMPGLTPELERARENFYQAHYSFARKLLLLTQLSKELVDSMGEVHTYEQFEQAEDRLFRYGSYLGFIFDMFERMDTALKASSNLCEDMRSFYNQRHHIIHTPQIPHTIGEDGVLKIPRIASEKGVDGQWHKSSVWSDIKNQDFVCLAEFVEETTNLFLDVVRKCHGRVFDAADRRFEGRRVVLGESESATSAVSASLSTFHQTVHPRTDQSRATQTAGISGQYVPPTPVAFSNSNL